MFDCSVFWRVFIFAMPVDVQTAALVACYVAADGMVAGDIAHMSSWIDS